MKVDFLDCFGDPAVTGKFGTNIEDNKCTWLVVQALDRATPQQRAILEVCVYILYSCTNGVHVFYNIILNAIWIPPREYIKILSVIYIHVSCVTYAI